MTGIDINSSYPLVNDGVATFTISGTPAVGKTLTATNSSPDPDGNGSFSHAWQASANGTSWATIGTGAQLTIAPAQEGQQLRLLTAYTDGQGFSESVTTAAGSVPAIPSITLTVSPASVTEDGTANLVFTFTRTGPTTNTLSVNYTVGGTATLDTDYTGIASTPATKTVTFESGSATAVVTVDPTDDTEIEPDETVSLALIAGSGYNVGTTTAVTGTISNDDEKPVFLSATLNLAHISTSFSSSLPTSSTGQISASGAPLYGAATTSGAYGSLTVSSGGATGFTGNTTSISAQGQSLLTDVFSVTATKGTQSATATYNVSIANPTAENNLLITATASGNIDGIGFGSTATTGAYTGILLSNINLGPAADTATVTDSAGTTAALTLSGGAGFDRLNGNAFANDLTLTGLDQGTLDLVSFFSIENVYLEGGNDTVTIQAGGRLSGILDGGAGSNILTVHGTYTIGIGTGGTITIDNGSGGGGSFSGFQTIRGGGGNSGGGGGGGGTPQGNSLSLNTNSNIVSITGPNSGTADGTAFTNINDINLAAGDDNAILAAVGSLTGTLSGGSGTDDLTLNSAVNSVVLIQSGVGTATSSGNAVTTAFSDFEIIRLDAGNDSVDLDLNGTTNESTKRQLRIDGGNGNDQITLRLKASERQNLVSTGKLAVLESYISNPTGQTLNLSLLEVDLQLSNFESAALIVELPIITLDVSPTSVTEDGTTSISYTFSRTGPTTSALTVNYTVGGSALFGTDYSQSGAASYTATSGTVTFAAGSATAIVTVDPTADTTIEPDETVALTLAAGTGYTIGTTAAVTAFIANDDRPRILGITTVGKTLEIQFSDPLVTTGLLANRFNATVAGVARTITSWAPVAGDLTKITLTLSGAPPTSSQDLALSYSDLTPSDDITGVVQDVAGNDMATIAAPGRNADTFSSSSSVTSLASCYDNLILTGTARLATGNDRGNYLTAIQSVSVANVFVGGDGIDKMDAGQGRDIYLIENEQYHSAAEINDSGTTGRDELRFSSSIVDQVLTVFAGDIGLEAVTIGTGSSATAITTATTPLSINAAAAPNGLSLSGNAGANGLTGTAFTDILTGGAGVDSMNGGNSSDYYLITSSDHHATAEVNDTGTSGRDELRFASITAGETLTVFSGDVGLEAVTIGTGSSAAAITTATTALSINAAAAPNGLALSGNAGPNVLIGSTFNDVLTGGAGLDALDGGDGSDLYLISNASHHLAAEVRDSGIGEGDCDELRFSSTLAGQTLTIYAGDVGLESITIGTGSSITPDISSTTVPLHVDAGAAPNALVISGSNGMNRLTGSAFADFLIGNAGNDTLHGGSDTDVLNGGDGADLLNGGIGNDILAGGRDADVFRFDSVLHSMSNVDLITDFSPAEGDRIQLENDVFKAMGGTGTLPASAFSVGSSATSGSQRIIYNPSTGAILYDPDGSGVLAAIRFATLSTGLELTNTRFTVT